MKTLALALVVLFTSLTCCFAQVTTTEGRDISSVGGFLDVCGAKSTQLSKESVEALKNAPAGQVLDTLKEGLASKSADTTLCFGFLNGLYEGWIEGHEQGVLASHFPAGVPRTESDPFHADLSSVPLNELDAMSAAMKNDVPCLPDRLTAGETMDVVIKYIRDFSLKNLFLWQALPTVRFVAPALRGAFPCPASATGTVAVTSVPDGADVNSDGSFVGNAPATLKLRVGKHTVRVSKNGYKDWSREITVQDGSEVRLNANLEKQ